MKKSNVLEYKGYHTKIEFYANDNVLRGKIEGINDLVDFESDSIKNIEEEFHLAVDDYLEFCKEVGKEPEKEYKGTFNVRIDPNLHKQLANIASTNGDTLNSCVEKAIKIFVSGEKEISEYLQSGLKKIIDGAKNESTFLYDTKSMKLSENIKSFFYTEDAYRDMFIKNSKETINSW